MEYKILIKFPTRGRPERFFNVFNQYYYTSKNRNLLNFLITCDQDDILMNNPEIKKIFQKYEKTTVIYGNSKTKVEAINADMNFAPEYDILLLASDDMVPVINGYDEIIRQKMKENYPDTDGVLWFFDGYRRDINTLCIIGKKYYERFNYIYHPSYKSFWCDNEFTDVANTLKKQKFFDEVIIRHVHPNWAALDASTEKFYRMIHPSAKSIGEDETFIRNSYHEEHDIKNYQSRKIQNKN